MESAHELRDTEFYYDLVTGEQIDFVHMIATMNVYFYQDMMHNIYPMAVDVGGWAGDCIQLAWEGKEQQIGATELQEYLSKRLGISGKFGLADLLADLDAINICKLTGDETDFRSTFEKYYNSLDERTRYQEFLTNCFPLVENEEQLKKAVREVLVSNSSFLVTRVYAKEGLADETDIMYQSAAGDCFATYLWNKAFEQE